jgi:hypothetical protein
VNSWTSSRDPAPHPSTLVRTRERAKRAATLCAAVHNAQRGASNIALLTSLAGGAFGNDESWIVAAMRRVLRMMRGTELEVKLVSYGPPSRALLEVAEEFG